MSAAPKTAIPAARSGAAKLAVRRRIILGVLILAAALGVFAACTTLTATPPPVPSVATGASRDVALARQVAEDYLNGVPPTVPLATGLPADFGLGDKPEAWNWEDLNLSGLYGVDNGQQFVQMVRFLFTLVTPGDGEEIPETRQLYQITVPMVFPDAGVPRVGGVPSVSRVDTLSGENWPGISVDDTPGGIALDSLPETVKKVITDWATAFVTGGIADDDLKRVTGDQDTTRVYDGLGGWKLSEVAVEGALPAPGTTAESSTGYLVRVRMMATPPGGTTPRALTYDVWVAQTSANQANPPVYAWSVGGAGQTLTQYANARPITQ